MAYSFRPHDPPAICPRCGFKYHVSDMKAEWTGLRVCNGPGTNHCWEARHPMDKMRAKPDPQRVHNASPEPADVFVDPGDITGDDL